MSASAPAADARLHAAAARAREAFAVISVEGTIEFATPSAERVLGAPVQRLLGGDVFRHVHPSSRDPLREALRELAGQPGREARADVELLQPNGRVRHVSVVAHNLLDDDQVRGILVGALDVTRSRRTEARLIHDAFYDKLTGLPNRSLFLDRVAARLRAVAPGEGGRFAVLYIDLDRFKLANDSLGHLAGDQLLAAFSRRLQATIPRDQALLARVGSDEFALLVESPRRSSAGRLGERIRRTLGEPFRVSGQEVYLSASVGVAGAPSPGAGPEDLLRQAEFAMSRARRLGPGAARGVFDPRAAPDPLSRLRLETELRRAIERREFELHYQPIVDLRTGSLAAFEALVRWRHPERGLLGPGAFIGLAEETGLIRPLGRLVLDEACAQLSRWTGEDKGQTVPALHVNVAAQQLAREDFASEVVRVLERHATPPELVSLELTESAMLGGGPGDTEPLRKLSERGVRLAIDDFGTGYSSLSYLHRVPADEVKLDRSFVERMGPGGQNSAIVRSVVELAHDLGIRVVAEGVETQQQRTALEAVGCDLGQGYLFSRPVTASRAAELLSSGHRW